MNHSREFFSGENLVKKCAVKNVALVKLWSGAGYFGDAIDNQLFAVRKIVDNDRGETRFYKLNAGVAANVAGAAGQENFHCNLLPKFICIDNNTFHPRPARLAQPKKQSRCLQQNLRAGICAAYATNRPKILKGFYHSELRSGFSKAKVSESSYFL
jgi:hypothetical protein